MTKKLNIVKRSPIKEKPSWVKTLGLITGYFFKSDEKLYAWLYLIGIILCVVGLVALVAAISWWSAGFWAVLTAKALGPFLLSMAEFIPLLVAAVGLNVLKNYLVGNLSISWREWLTKNIINQLFGSKRNYLELKRTSPEIDNIGQRIQEDSKSFVDLSLNLMTGLIRSVLSLGWFAASLWIVGGPLAIAVLGLNIVIPGYLVWVALLIAIVATITTHFLARNLAEANQKTESKEADLRQGLTVVGEDAERIAVEHTEEYYQQSLTKKVGTLSNISRQRLQTQTRVVAFQSFYEQLPAVLPSLVSAPLYFSGLIEIGQLMQIGFSFFQVSSSLSWFVNSYEDLSKYQTTIARITELQHALENEKIAAEHRAIIRKEKNKEVLKIKDLAIKHPLGTGMKLIMRGLNLEINPGDRILLKGNSGIGKSTLFKIASGTWNYGSGKISVPAGKTMDFLAQEPTLRKSSLRALLAYPKPAGTYTLKQCAEVLRKIGGLEDLVPGLNDPKIRDWSKELSGGEQQKIALARVLLRKPAWVFLDEATSKLDEESEARVYSEINKLKNTTVVSIAHRSTVEKYHSRVAFFKVNKETRQVTVTENKDVLAVAQGGA